jgi:epoxyqueuosine reductase QueG
MSKTKTVPAKILTTEVPFSTGPAASTPPRNARFTGAAGAASADVDDGLSPRHRLEMKMLFEKYTEQLHGKPVRYHLKNSWWRTANIALGCFQNMTLVLCSTTLFVRTAYAVGLTPSIGL